MPTRTPKRPAKPATPAPAPKITDEIVDPRWLLKALAITVAVAALCAYLAVCLLIYQGGWQRLLFPAHTVDQTPASLNIPFQPIHFDATETGNPRLTGWWMPAQSPSAPTILFLHDGIGSLASPLRTFEMLHRANLNVFAFDYRGFGQSTGPHPTEARMNQDAAAALDYLINTRHIPSNTIIPYGQGLGSVLAANLIAHHPDLPALIIDNPDPEAFQRVTANPQFRFLPARTLIQEHFDLATALAGSTKPKLLFVNGPDGYITDRVRTNQAFFRTLPDPKLTVTFPSVFSEDAYIDSVHRFLDQDLPQPAPALSLPTPAPANPH